MPVTVHLPLTTCVVTAIVVSVPSVIVTEIVSPLVPVPETATMFLLLMLDVRRLIKASAGAQ